MWHDIPKNFMKISTGIQDILWVYLRNLNGCDVGVTNEKDLQCVSLRWTQVASYTSEFHEHSSLKTPWLSVRKRTIPTERPPLVGKI
jgi:hypothetical protein